MNEPSNRATDSGTPHRVPPAYGADDEIDLVRLKRILLRGKWKIAACLGIALALALLYLFIAQPTYKADSLIEIQSEQSSPLQGITSKLGGFSGQSGVKTQGQIQIIKSRAVIGKTVDTLNLTTRAEPHYFPVVGGAIVRAAACWRQTGKPWCDKSPAETIKIGTTPARDASDQETTAGQPSAKGAVANNINGHNELSDQLIMSPRSRPHGIPDRAQTASPGQAANKHVPVESSTQLERDQNKEHDQHKPPPADVPASAGNSMTGTYYAWGPTEVDVPRMVVPTELYGDTFTLRALGKNHYVLYGPHGKLILQGRVGHVASGQTDRGGTVKLFVAKLFTSSPPTDFTLVQRRWLPVVEGLTKRMAVAEQGDYTGIVQISLEGTDKTQITRIVDSISENYLRQNVEARSQKAQKSLEFLKTQLPKLRDDVDRADARLAKFRKQHQVADLDAVGKALLNRVSTLETRRSQQTLKMAELRQSYTGNFPAMEAAQEQARKLDQEKQQLEKSIDKLPDAQKRILSLQRDVNVSSELYTEMLNRVQELQVAKAGTIGNVRIIDNAAKPVKSVSPRVALILLLSLLPGAIIGIGFVLLQARFRRGVDDPNEIENRLGLPVYAVVPFSNWLAKYGRRARRHNGPAPILARDHGDELAVEALGSLCTSLYFAQMEAGSNAVLVTGPTQGVGKSFVSANLAYLVAETDKRVVIVDADMRKGRMHEFMDEQTRAPGLADVLAGEVSWRQALRDISSTSIKVLTTGTLPHKPRALLMRPSFGQLIKELQQEFDLVIVDAPPVLAVTDATVIAVSVPDIVTFLVARAGSHPMAELQETVKRFSRQNRKITGVVVNALKQVHDEYAGGYSYYQYEYKSSS